MIIIMSDLIQSLFSGSRLLDCAAGQELFPIGASVTEMFLVVSGQVHLRRHSLHGVEMVLQRASEGMVLAEASAYSTRYHCSAIAVTASVLHAVPKSSFLAALAEDRGRSEAWAARLAREVQAARMRSEIRSLPRVAERLDAWLGEGNRLPDKGHWQDVASELGVSREALYRELARRRGSPPGT